MGFFNNIKDIPIAEGDQKVPNDVIHKIDIFGRWIYFKAVDIDKANAGLDPVKDEDRFFDCHMCVFKPYCDHMSMRPSIVPACEKGFDLDVNDYEQVFLNATNGILQ